MASTYSDLKVELIGTGEQSGTWGTTTNTNLSVALGEAITGSADVTFASANATITLTDTNGAQAARNLRLNLTGTSSGTHYLILGSGCNIEKLYLINNTLGNAIIVQNTAGGTGVTVPASKSMFVYNTGTNVVDAVTHLSSLTLGTDLAVADGGTGSSTLTAENVILGNGTSAVKFVAPGSSGNILTSNGTTWTSSAPPASGVTTFSAGTTGLTPNSASNGAITLGGTLAIGSGGTGATTDSGARTNLGLGTIATQDSNNVSITGGTVSGITDLAVADGGTGSSTLTAENVILGNGTNAVKFVAPGTSGNVLTSDGTTWASQAAVSGGGYAMNAYESPAPWTKPAGLKAVRVRVVGAGGSGGSPSPPASGGGGGGGGYAEEYIPAPAIPGPVTVTAGPGTNSFGAFCSATAGANGTAAPTPGNPGAGGAGGTGSGGTINIPGGRGIPGGGGGSSILSAWPGNNPAPAGGTSKYGNGGSSGVAGSIGIVIVEEFY